MGGMKTTLSNSRVRAAVHRVAASATPFRLQNVAGGHCSVYALIAEEDIDGFVALDVEMMRCGVFGAAFLLTKKQCRGMLNLCISDAGETLRSYS